MGRGLGFIPYTEDSVMRVTLVRFDCGLGLFNLSVEGLGFKISDLWG